MTAAHPSPARRGYKFGSGSRGRKRHALVWVPVRGDQPDVGTFRPVCNFGLDAERNPLDGDWSQVTCKNCRKFGLSIGVVGPG